MNIGELAIRRGTFTWTLSAAILVLGWLAYERLSHLQIPDISIREARVITPYPGASAAEVEQEISDRIEKAALALDHLERVESYSSRGLSVVSVLVQDGCDKGSVPRLRDELGHRIGEVQAELPPGAGPSIVDQHFGDVYGSYFGLVGEGFTLTELKRVAELLRGELSNLEGVRKAILFGEPQETLHVEISRLKTKAFGIAIEEVLETLGHKNLAADSGRIRIGPEHVPISPSALYRSEQDLGDLLIAGSRDRLIRLGDLAKIRRGYEEPPHQVLQIDGRVAIGIALSTAPGYNPIATSKAVERRLAELAEEMPLGMELKAISVQSETIAKVIEDSVTRLAQALTILILVLVLLLGLRSGLIVGTVTLLTLAATFVAMDAFRIALEPISLGALVIAIGLIPGSPILVVRCIQGRMHQGLTGIAAAREAVARNALPLLGGTAAIVLAFAPIAGMGTSVGEYIRTPFLVILVALPISWLASLTVVPLLADRFLRAEAWGKEESNPDGGRLRRLYARLLGAAIHHRWVVLGAAGLLLALSLYGFGSVNRAFFSPSTGPDFLVEVRFREGTHISETQRQMEEVQAFLRNQPGVAQVATAIGIGHPVHLWSSNRAPDAGGHSSLSLISVEDHRRVDALAPLIQAELEERFPDTLVRLRQTAHPWETVGGRIQLRISGPDAAELRRLANRVKAVIAQDPEANTVHDDWGAKVKVAYPVLAQARARRLGMDRTRIAAAMRTAYSGTIAGFYREGTELIPILVRAPPEERSTVEDMAEIQVTSPLRGDRISMHELVNRLDTRTEDARRLRRNRLPTITVHADADRGRTLDLFERIKPRVEAALKVDVAAYLGRDPGPAFEIGADTVPIVQDGRIPLQGRPDYFIAWGGEAENAAEARAQLWSWIPYCFGLVILILIALFNALRQPLIILLVIPLAMIGGTAGLLLTGQPFGLMSLIGILGLSGMLIGQAILLIDRIDLEINVDKARPAAILRAGSDRSSALAIAAATSGLTMLPLLQDELFVSTAVILIPGLAFATLAGLVVLPVLYATLFRIRNHEGPRTP